MERDTKGDGFPRFVVNIKIKTNLGTNLFEAVAINTMTSILNVMHAVTTEATFITIATKFVTTIDYGHCISPQKFGGKCCEIHQLIQYIYFHNLFFNGIVSKTNSKKHECFGYSLSIGIAYLLHF